MLACLQPGGWLNSDVIEYYLELIEERSMARRPKVHAFSTHFLSLLRSGKITNEDKGWTKSRNVFNYELILIPVHSKGGNHWSLMAFNSKKNTLSNYDSMYKPSKDEDVNSDMSLVIGYLGSEYQSRMKRKFPEIHRVRCSLDRVPQQANSSDCGIFTCMFAEHLSRSRPFTFTQDLMPYFRLKMAAELLDKALMDLD